MLLVTNHYHVPATDKTSLVAPALFNFMEFVPVLLKTTLEDTVSVPVAAGVLYPLGILLSPAVGALAMSASSITVATNAVLLKGVEKHLRAEQQTG